MPEISIITPVRNAAPWLHECLESGQNQSHQDWEWIWVNDGSEDESLDILWHYAARDNRIRILENPGEGILPALQEALKNTSGKYITRMDADDIMPDDRLEVLCNALKESAERTVVTGQVIYFGKRDVSPGYRKYEQWLNEVQIFRTHWQNIYRECVVASPNWMMRSAELRAIGGFDQLSYPEDYDLVFRWYRSGFSIRSVHDVTLMWREHPDRTSRHSEHYQQEAFFNLKVRRFLELEQPKGPILVWGTGKKADLCIQSLKKLKARYLQMDHKPDPKQKVIHFEETANMHNPCILLTVYPPLKQLESIRQYLNMLGLREGKNYWLL